MYQLIVDDSSLRNEPPVKIGCFQLDEYENIRKAKSVMMEGITKKNGLMRCNVVYPSDDHRFYKSDERQQEGKQMLCPCITIAKAIEEDVKIGTFKVIVEKVFIILLRCILLFIK